MTYQPQTCVWEITMGCNMRCKHCGSSCADPLPGELSTGEALDAIRQMADIGLKWITLSGGEPLTRRDWPELVKALSDQGIMVNMITNGWLVTESIAKQLVAGNISTVAISVDGNKEIHDRIRKPGSFERLERSFKILRDAGINCGAVTTISKENIHILRDIKEELIRMGVSSWQVQLGLPMGNFAQQDWLLEPRQVDDILDFCYDTIREGRIIVYTADCLGYYSHKELQIRQMAFNAPGYQLWDGCNAGIRGFGLLHDGNILGCTSIRNREYVEGNIRERSLRSIWEDKQAFQWRRSLTKGQLDGHCRTCKYGSKCLGGCPNTRLTIHGTIYGENDYCSYNLALKNSEKQWKQYRDPDTLVQFAQGSAGEGEFQRAAQQVGRALELEGNHLEAWRLKGYAEFMNGNYDLCEAANRKALALNAGDSYAKKGLGLALYRQGKHEEGLNLIRQIVLDSQYKDQDAVDDLAALYNERGETEKARQLRANQG